MFYFLSKLLDLLVTPIGWTLLLLGLAVLFRRRRAAPWLAGAAFLVLWAFSTDPVSNAIMRSAEASAPHTVRPGVVYDAVVVLGGGLDPGASEVSGRPELGPGGDRLVAGYELVRAGRARNVVLSAGGEEPDRRRVEADWSADLYRSLGVPEERVIVERTSRNTRENAVESARIARERGFGSLLLVTSALHATRALGTFRAVGLSPDVLPVDTRAIASASSFLPRVAALERSTDAIREVVGRVVYRLAGYSRP